MAVFTGGTSLGANVRRDPSFLRARNLHERLTPETLAVYVSELEERCNDFSIATKMRTLASFARRALRPEDAELLRAEAQKFERRVRAHNNVKSDTSSRSFAIPEADLPAQFRPVYDALKKTGKSGPQYAAEFCRYLGSQVAAGVDIDKLPKTELASEFHLANFENKLGNVTPTRLTGLGSMLIAGIPGIDVSAIQARASDLRKKASTNPESYDRRSRPYDELPPEAKARFDFAVTYDGKRSFIFDGCEVPLAKARNLDGGEYSAAHINDMRLALRMHYTVLLDAAPALAANPSEWPSKEALAWFQAHYADLTPITQASRLDHLIAALRAIGGDRKPFRAQRRQIRLLSAVARKISDPLVVPFLPTRKTRRRSRAVARIALRRWRDLVHSSLAYQDPTRVAGQFRTALIVAILSEMPIRLRTIELLQNDWMRKVRSRYTVTVPADAMKNRRAYFRELSGEVSRLITAWTEEVRPFMLDNRPDPGVFLISDEGTALSRHIFQISVPAFMESFFGFRIPMHAIRKLHASELVDDPERASRRLQHKNGESKKAYQGHAQVRDQSRSSNLYDQSSDFFEQS